MSKLAALLLIAVLAVSSLVMIASVSAESIPKPSIPEFTVNFEADPYDVPPLFGIDPYTGENVTIREGYHVKNESIIVIIQGEPFTPYTNEEGHEIRLSYTVLAKGHFTEDWTGISGGGTAYSDPEYTVFSYILEKNADDSMLRELTVGDQVDFKVQASIGYSYQVNDPSRSALYQMYFPRYDYVGEHSGWSDIQTLTIPPRVTLLLPQNGNFSISNIPLDFAVDGEASQVEYSLDGGDKMTITGNTTLTGLANGYHNLTVYATDKAGNTGVSETIHFSVDVPFPTTLVVASIITVTFVSIGLLVYFKKHKR